MEKQKKIHYVLILLSCLKKYLCSEASQLNSSYTTKRLQKNTRKQIIIYRDINNAHNEYLEDKIKQNAIEEEKLHQDSLKRPKNNSECIIYDSKDVTRTSCSDLECSCKNTRCKNLKSLSCEDHKKRRLNNTNPTQTPHECLHSDLSGFARNKVREICNEVPESTSTSINNNLDKNQKSSNIATLSLPEVEFEQYINALQTLINKRKKKKSLDIGIQCETCFTAFKLRKKSTCNEHLVIIEKTFNGAEKLIYVNYRENSIKKVENQENMIKNKIVFLKLKCDSMAKKFFSCFDLEQRLMLESLIIEFKNNSDVDPNGLSLMTTVIHQNYEIDSDPFYIWKTHNLPLQNCLHYYNIQTNSNSILKLLIETERETINRLFDVEYIALLELRFESLVQYQEVIVHYTKKKLTYKNSKCHISVGLVQSNLFSCIYTLYYNGTHDTNYETFIIYRNRVIKLTESFKLNSDFEFDDFLMKATVEKEVFNLPTCSVELSEIKNILIGVLKHAKNDILLIFPEIDIICDYLSKTKIYRFMFLKNDQLYTYLHMLYVLSVFVQYEWCKVYFLEDLCTINLTLKQHVMRLASTFSKNKFEIFKLISFCILPFITDELYTFYAQTRILERFYLCVYNSEFIKAKNHNFNAIFYVGRFNIIARFLFISGYNIKGVFTSHKFLPDTETVLFFLLNCGKLSDFCRFLTVTYKYNLMIGLFQRYFSIYTYQYNYFRTIDEIKNNENDSESPCIATDPSNINIKRFKSSEDIINTIDLLSPDVDNILNFLLEFEGCWINKGYKKLFVLHSVNVH
ncbi:hypothetical protein COBT_000758 [Conglomerata obtusa]